MQLLNHRRVRQLLPWYVNGTLEGEELTEVERHLRRCSRCRAEIEGLQKLQADLRTALEGPALSTDLLENALELIEAERLLEEGLKRTLRLPGAERPMKELNFGLFVLGFSLGVAYERGRLPFRAELSALGLPLAKIKGRF